MGTRRQGDLCAPFVGSRCNLGDTSTPRQGYPCPPFCERRMYNLSVSTSTRQSLITIIGPTAAGKSALALEAAEAFGGEIVTADSRQVYRYMDIGTDKPAPELRRRAPHHLIDLVDPDEAYTLA